LIIIMFHFLFFMLFCPLMGMAAAPAEIPPDLWNAFTSNGQIPVTYWYFDDSTNEEKTISKELLDLFAQKAKHREWSYNGELDTFVFAALDRLAGELNGKEVCVMGSFLAWYEGILLSYGARPVVIDYFPIVSPDPRVTYLTKELFWKNPRKFDLILSISHTDHQGLGRYGESVDPDGDLKEMASFKQMLNPGGKLLLAVPIGPDALVWNAHRIYGWKRLPILLKGWKPIKYYGFRREYMKSDAGYHYEPALLLTPRM
jgi:hypothetical protein